MILRLLSSRNTATIHQFVLMQKVVDILGKDHDYKDILSIEQKKEIPSKRKEKVLLFLQKYRDFKTVAFKEYYDYSPICAYAESYRYFRETIMTIMMYVINRIEERDTK